MLCFETRRESRPLVQSDNKQDVPCAKARGEGDTEQNSGYDSERIGSGTVIHSHNN